MEMYLGGVCGMPGGEQEFVQCLVGNVNESDKVEEVRVWKDNTKIDHKNGTGGFVQVSFG
jgi:hypothetical protein